MILVDTREQSNKFVIEYFEKENIPYREEKLDEGDYQIEFENDIVVERKQDLLELAGNICSKDHQRFKRELLRAMEKGKKVYVVVADKKIRSIEEVKNWSSKYSQVKGETLMKAMQTINERYNVDYIFDKECNIGFQIEKILKCKGEQKMHIEGDYLILDVIPKKKKITGTKLPVLLNENPYKCKGSQVLELFGLTPPEKIDEFYTKRGEIAEKLVYEELTQNRFICKMWDKKEIKYDNFQNNQEFGGMIDIAITHPYRCVVECKSKNIKDYQKIKTYGNKHEERQGMLYATLSMSKLIMAWVFFNNETEECIRNNKPFNPKGFNEKGEPNVMFYLKPMLFDMNESLEDMQKAINYVNDCYYHKRIPLKDLDEKTLRQIGIIK